jgi:alpha-L-fucosidase 2
MKENNNSRKLVLWYTKPATEWETEVLPIGNAYLGATVNGGIKEEILVLNEKTLWTGGPSKNRPDYRGGNRNENSYQYNKEIRQALFNGEHDKAASLVQKLTGIPKGYGAYQLFGNLILKYSNIEESKVVDYRRWLDIASSVAGVEFACDGIRYEREYFASYSANIIAVKLTANQRHALSFTASLSKTQPGAVIRAIGDTIICSGEIEDNGLAYEGQIKLNLKGGRLMCKGDSITVSAADEVIIYFTAATDYANLYPSYRSGISPQNTVSKYMKAASEKEYIELKTEHITDYKSLFDRAEVMLGGDYIDFPTDVLLHEYKSHLSCANNNSIINHEQYHKQNQNQMQNYTQDRYLEMLYFQYGRYLLISSSRIGTLPANLQGVWNESNTPPWACDYHINVNLQMNYWPAYVTNIAETAKPLVDYLEGLRIPGRVTAKEYYGVVTDDEHPENGWIAHTQSTPFGFTCPGWDFYWGWSSAACAWLDQNIWEYYEFTGDKEYLKAAIYPIMRESVNFYIQELIYDHKQKRLVSSPSYSPEHGPVSNGNTYEQSLIEQLFKDYIAASKALEVDVELRSTVEALITDLKPYWISEKTGVLKEWFEEDEEIFDRSQVDPHHRHTSHLLGLYPGKSIHYETPELLEAAKASLNARGDEATGWGRAIKALMWSRTGDGERAHQLFQGLLKDCTNDNLWDMCPPFQIDGNFGGTATIAEMLIQSHMGYISVLPAIPKVWDSGNFTGLCARNGFVLDAAWKNGKLTKLIIHSKNGERCKIKSEKAVITSKDGIPLTYCVMDGILIFETKKNESYCFTF